MMKIIHGFWEPETDDDFIQSGHFYLWIETDKPNGGSPKGHPNQLAGPELSYFCLSELKLQPGDFGEPIKRELSLPTSHNQPLPSPESVSIVIEEEDEPEITLNVWKVECVPLSLPLQALNQIHFFCTYHLEMVTLGSDLIFWYYFSQSIKQVIHKDQYIPEILRRQGKNKGADSLYRIWQIASEPYELLIHQAKEQIPLVSSQGYEPESLLRHFSEVVLNEVLDLACIKIPQSARKPFVDTLLESFFSSTRLLGKGKEWLSTFEAWYPWQQKVSYQSEEDMIQLCFRLEEAGEDPDRWSLHFLAASRHEPSIKQELSAYWQLSASEKKARRVSLGHHFELQILRALGAAARIYPRLWLGMKTMQPHSVQLTLDEAFEFLKESAWVLEDAGFKVIVPAWWTPKGRQRAKLRLRTSQKSSAGSSESGKGILSFDNLVDYQYELSIGGQPVTPEEWEQLLEASSPLIQFRGQWMELDQEKMQQMLEFWQQHGHEKPQISVQDMIKQLAEQESVFELDQSDTLTQMLSKLTDQNSLELIEQPKGLNATLRDYQRRGVSWLRFLEQLGLHGCLADDMGLGKTIQVITSLLVAQEQNDGQLGPTLLIAPTSVMGNWQKEVSRFAPSLTTTLHHGGGRPKTAREFKEACRGYAMVITSYAMARKDQKLLGAIEWERIVLDEAQNIKNPKAAQTRAIYKLKSRYRLALTGTPVENRLMDLWSVFHFLNPGYLASQAVFRRAYEIPIQRGNNAQQTLLLKKLVSPYILRRLKSDQSIIKDLPDKVENKLYCNLSKEQAALYEAVVNDVLQQLEEKDGIERQGLMLSTLTRLKQICNHPMQFLQDGSAFTPERSHKLERMGEMLEEALADEDSVLIFTQFTEIGDRLVRYLRREKQVNCYYLHGGVSRTKREAMISEFQDPQTKPSVFVLSLKAGGVGITLTHANHVFHFDRWWNPAVEDQATDRAFRIGQKKNVFVHKFITLGTLEERIDEMIEDKKQIAGSIVGSDESWLSQLDNESFKSLIALNQQTIVE